MRTILSGCLAWVWLATIVVAQSPTAGDKQSLAEAAPESVDPDLLPPPLNLIRSNLRGLEATGYFSVGPARWETTSAGEYRLVWSLRVTRTITARHAEALLRGFRDARFYYTLDNGTLVPVLSTLLHYSDRIVQGAANNRLLQREDLFEVWISLTDLQQRKLIAQQADRLVFRRWKY